MISFFIANNLVASEMHESNPWEFSPPEDVLQQLRTMPKEQRRRVTLDPKTQWNCYSTIRGLAPNLRIAKENPPVAIHGVAADYDAKVDWDSVEDYINELPPQFRPNFLEVTLSKKVRLVWVFERPLLVPDMGFCVEFLKLILKKIGAPTCLAGYDPASEKPTQLYTNGGEWFAISPDPLPFKFVQGIACDVSKKVEWSRGEVPLELIAQEVEKRFPGRWQGPFELNQLGVRFWDPSADCPTGAQIKPDGVLCFTGRVPFMKWSDIFGQDWITQQRALNLAKAAGEIYFDGKWYWQFVHDRWQNLTRQDVMLGLQARGLSAKAAKGQTLSDAEQVLHHIQTVNRVHGAAPLVCYSPGLVRLDGDLILNINTCRALPPSEKKDVVPERDFPWIWHFLNNLFDHGPEALQYFLAWTQRAYHSNLFHKPTFGQAVFLCGPFGNGKTLLSIRILRPLLGGKASMPYDYLTGQNQFNAHILETSFLAMNDEDAPTGPERTKYNSRLKGLTVNPYQLYHAKFCGQTRVRWSGRIFATLNDDAESVGNLPEVNGNTADKYMFFGSRPYQGTWPPQEELEAIIERELPFFARWLLDHFVPPPEIMTEPRMGVKSFFDPRILRLGNRQLPGHDLLELLQLWCETGTVWEQDSKLEFWEGTPSRLMMELSHSQHLETHRREWTIYKLSKALTALSKQEGSGVTVVENASERLFRFEKKLILRHL